MVSIFNLLNKTQDELLTVCASELSQRGYKSIYADTNFVFAEGNIPIMLVAHLDTVHKELPEVYYDPKKKVMWSPQGIGGDDRCGVYAILKICETHKPYILFTTDEEIGGRGASTFCDLFKDIELKKYINFMIEIDRRGRNQAVFYQCGNKEFQDYILSFGFDHQYGTFTDISTIAPYFDIAAVNFSAGYYNEHTTTEHIKLDDLYHTINKVKEILDDTKNHKYYDFQEVKYVYVKTYKSYKDYEVPYYVEQDWRDLSDDDWLKWYGYKKPKTLKKLKEIYWEDDYFGMY